MRGGWLAWVRIGVLGVAALAIGAPLVAAPAMAAPFAGTVRKVELHPRGEGLPWSAAVVVESTPEAGLAESVVVEVADPVTGEAVATGEAPSMARAKVAFRLPEVVVERSARVELVLTRRDGTKATFPAVTVRRPARGGYGWVSVGSSAGETARVRVGAGGLFAEVSGPVDDWDPATASRLRVEVAQPEGRRVVYATVRRTLQAFRVPLGEQPAGVSPEFDVEVRVEAADAEAVATVVETALPGGGPTDDIGKVRLVHDDEHGTRLVVVTAHPAARATAVDAVLIDNATGEALLEARRDRPNRVKHVFVVDGLRFPGFDDTAALAGRKVELLLDRVDASGAAVGEPERLELTFVALPGDGGDVAVGKTVANATFEDGRLRLFHAGPGQVRAVLEWVDGPEPAVVAAELSFVSARGAPVPADGVVRGELVSRLARWVFDATELAEGHAASVDVQLLGGDGEVLDAFSTDAAVPGRVDGRNKPGDLWIDGIPLITR